MRNNSNRPYKNKVQNPTVSGSKQLLTDGGVEVGSASTSDVESGESPPGDTQFAFEAMEKEDVSVSIEADQYVVTVRGPDRGIIDGSQVVDLVNDYGLVIRDAYTDIEEGALTVEVGR